MCTCVSMQDVINIQRGTEATNGSRMNDFSACMSAAPFGCFFYSFCHSDQ